MSRIRGKYTRIAIFFFMIYAFLKLVTRDKPQSSEELDSTGLEGAVAVDVTGGRSSADSTTYEVGMAFLAVPVRDAASRQARTRVSSVVGCGDQDDTAREVVQDSQNVLADRRGLGLPIGEIGP